MGGTPSKKISVKVIFFEGDTKMSETERSVSSLEEVISNYTDVGDFFSPKFFYVVGNSTPISKSNFKEIIHQGDTLLVMKYSPDSPHPDINFLFEKEKLLFARKVRRAIS